MRFQSSGFLLSLLALSSAYKYDPAWVQYNLNENQVATNPINYWGEWHGHQYTASPTNWRFPFYTLFLDRFVNGDPTNDNINNTLFEHDMSSNQMRHGGDLQGLIDTLDYLEGMGVKGLYIAGSPFMNQPWAYDSYSPLDLTLLDHHFGTIDTWRTAIDEIHKRGMYVILDNTFGTLGDLLGFEGFLNETAPFVMEEHEVVWKSDRVYHDFKFGNEYNVTCKYPRFWLDTGFPVSEDVSRHMVGCYDSEFDQYGDTEAFGVFPDWRRQLSKFASVQDRLRDWYEPTRNKIENFYCMVIAQLDIDGYRFDKATQATPDALALANQALRKCANRFGKDNFFLPGEITGGNAFGSIFLGRGRQPNQVPATLDIAASLGNQSGDRYFLREPELNALDAGAFHYTVYRTLTRFLGMDGDLEASFDSPPNWVEQWYDFVTTNDLVNANTGQFDPRHMYGVTNQDLFRWPGIKMGIERQLLGHFITTLTLPGIPLLLWGEEQAFYVWDNTATNYIFGRQAMSAATAWKTHGCYTFPTPSTQFYKMPVEAARQGCNDDWNIRDHRDPGAPIRNILRHMFYLRDKFPVLTDGFYLQQLSNQTNDIYMPASENVRTETGIWSVVRSQWKGVQDLSKAGGANDQPVWLIYSNLGEAKTYNFDCKSTGDNYTTKALVSPFDAGTTVKNLFYPHDEHILEESTFKLGLTNTSAINGCLSDLAMSAYGFGAYVPKPQWVDVQPMITKFVPGHDARILASGEYNDTQTLDIELQFSIEMSCDSVSKSLSLNSTTESGIVPTVDSNSVVCAIIENPDVLPYVGVIPSAWSWKATLTNVTHGVHQLTVNRPVAEKGNNSSNALDKFTFRVGLESNPIVFPLTGNYSRSLLFRGNNGKLFLQHRATGADKWRYSTNWGSSFSNWMDYSGGNTTIDKQPWTGTKAQEWVGEHVRVEYFSRLGGSSDHVQEGDIETDKKTRRFPHLFLNGPYNLYGYDAGLPNEMEHTDDATWEHHFMTEWRSDGTLGQINVWGINSDGKPDQSMVFGDADGDSVLDRLPPSSLSGVVLNITSAPVKPFLAWRFVVNDGSMRFHLVPAGNMWYQFILYILLWTVPVAIGSLAVWSFMKSFYHIKFNQMGISEKANLIPAAVRRQLQKVRSNHHRQESSHLLSVFKRRSRFLKSTDALANVRRRTVLIATMEYDIEDWSIKIKIGGLGVMAQLMGKNLGHQDLIWVVPCVGGIDYPYDTAADPMYVTVLGTSYEIKVQYHILRNITYVLLDAPVFRQQTKDEPYPPRMDDMSSAIYYSAWNQCIAQAISRFAIDIYHINDYHGSVAPLYLLPQTVPVCLSLHNAEFQGLWPMRTKEERDEVCSVFHLSPKIAYQYVQFGEVFNLLHAGASYLRKHQQGFGAVGVSKKYGKRAYMRYPIFWGLNKVGKLPNPDPSDTGEWDKKLPTEAEISVDADFEAQRPVFRQQAQKWADLHVNPKADLFVFVGRWSMQKGIDLIADIFPSILEAHKDTQLLVIGPVIDLYGKFAAAKFDRMMELYPGRVCSKPVFTQLPPFIFAGAEFALIPSRDEPFGLVAVEFGRKGALGVGARVGGLGQMPGWWYTIESMTTGHLLHQFRLAIEEALSCKQAVRALMRARSAKQRFPVAQWVEDLEILQSTAIRIHGKQTGNRSLSPFGKDVSANVTPTFNSPTLIASSPGTISPLSRPSSLVGLAQLGQRLKQIGANVSKENVSDQVPAELSATTTGLSRKASMGSRRGPGHFRSRLDPANRRNVLSTVTDTEEHMRESRNMSIYGSGSDSPTSEYGDNERVYNQETLPTRSTSLANGIGSSPYQAQYDSSGFLPLDHPLSGNQSSKPVDQDMPSPTIEDLIPPPAAWSDRRRVSSTPSMLSIDTVVGEKTDFNLQKVDPWFADRTGEYYEDFERKLENLNGENSESAHCIEEFLVKSEKKWFDGFRNAKLGRYASSPSTNNARSPTPTSPPLNNNNSSSMSFLGSSAPDRGKSPSVYDDEQYSGGAESNAESNDEFLLGRNYTPPTGLKKWMQLRIGDWPVYSFFLAFGQIIAANSYQITLLTGEIGQSANKLYAIATVYLVTSMVWWVVFRRVGSVICLSLPFLFYGLAFLIIGMAHFANTTTGRGWVQNVGSASYAIASSSGSLFFALNFGDEGGAQVRTWVLRACLIQGTQQIYVVVLWYWGSVLNQRMTLTSSALANNSNDSFANSYRITLVTIPLAMMFWCVGVLIWKGLPNYYRNPPGAMPNFYKSLILRRKIVLWFFVTVVVQNFFLSAPYGRNWNFLFASHHASPAQIFALVVFFFVVVWAAFLYGLGRMSKRHAWILPLFAIGLGAPRWAQIWWATSNIGHWLPWAGGYTASALLSRALWLWLGVLDAIQGVGLGMILLTTLTRVHVAFTLIMAQILGSVATIVARACAPNRIGPGPISPDISLGLGVLWQAWFWVGLLCNLGVCGGYFMFYRKEQLAKP